MIDLERGPLEVWRWTTRTSPSDPGEAPVIRPVRHESGGEFGTWITTRLPIQVFSCGSLHFLCCWRVWRYGSSVSRSVVPWLAPVAIVKVGCWAFHSRVVLGEIAQVLLWENFLELSCPPLKDQMIGELEALEFKIASIRVESVMNSSKTRIWSPMTLWRWCLILWTNRSHKPPWWGTADGKKWNSSQRLLSSLYSHCGSNFVGASSELRKIIQNFLTLKASG